MKSILVVVLSSLLPALCAAQQPVKAVAKVSVPQNPRQDASRQDAMGTTIYKRVDDRGHVTYSNRPMQGAEVVELEPITVIPSGPRLSLGERPEAAAVAVPAPARSAAPSPAQPAGSGNQVALVQPILPKVDTDLQKKRDESRRRILEEEMKAEQKLLADAVIALSAVEGDRSVIEQMRKAAAQQTPSAYAEARRNYAQREERLRSMQDTVAGHEKNVTALKRELASLR